MSTVAKNATRILKNWFMAMRLRPARIADHTQRINSCPAAPIAAAALRAMITRLLLAVAVVAPDAPDVKALADGAREGGLKL